MQASSFHLVSTIHLLQTKWKQILFFVAAALIVAAISLFFVPKQYRSHTLLVSANPQLADKAHLLNQNIQNLYSVFGTGDDLERINGIATMDTVYKQLVDELNLIGYYDLKGEDQNKLRYKAALELKDDIHIQKTELSQLSISIFTTNADLSSKIVNRLVEITRDKEEAIWKNGYEKMLIHFNRSIDSLRQSYVELYNKSKDTKLQRLEIDSIEMNHLLEQIQSQEKAAGEIKLAIDNNAPGLFVLEPAVPAAKSEKPNIPEVLLLTALSSFVFCSLLLLINNRESVL
jgi:capsular polysaccharide biosynthesis protein